MMQLWRVNIVYLRGRRFNTVYYDSQTAICSSAGNKRPADLTQQIECYQTAFAPSSYQYCMISPQSKQ